MLKITQNFKKSVFMAFGLVLVLQLQAGNEPKTSSPLDSAEPLTLEAWEKIPYSQAPAQPQPERTFWGDLGNAWRAGSRPILSPFEEYQAETAEYYRELEAEQRDRESLSGRRFTAKEPKSRYDEILEAQDAAVVVSQATEMLRTLNQKEAEARAVIAENSGGIFSNLVMSPTEKLSRDKRVGMAKENLYRILGIKEELDFALHQDTRAAQLAELEYVQQRINSEPREFDFTKLEEIEAAERERAAQELAEQSTTRKLKTKKRQGQESRYKVFGEYGEGAELPELAPIPEPTVGSAQELAATEPFVAPEEGDGEEYKAAEERAAAAESARQFGRALEETRTLKTEKKQGQLSKYAAFGEYGEGAELPELAPIPEPTVGSEQPVASTELFVAPEQSEGEEYKQAEQEAAAQALAEQSTTRKLKTEKRQGQESRYVAFGEYGEGAEPAERNLLEPMASGEGENMPVKAQASAQTGQEKRGTDLLQEQERMLAEQREQRARETLREQTVRDVQQQSWWERLKKWWRGEEPHPAAIKAPEEKISIERHPASLTEQPSIAEKPEEGTRVPIDRPELPTPPTPRAIPSAEGMPVSWWLEQQRQKQAGKPTVELSEQELKEKLPLLGPEEEKAVVEEQEAEKRVAEQAAQEQSGKEQAPIVPTAESGSRAQIRPELTEQQGFEAERQPAKLTTEGQEQETQRPAQRPEPVPAAVATPASSTQSAAEQTPTIAPTTPVALPSAVSSMVGQEQKQPQPKRNQNYDEPPEYQ